MSEAIAHRLKEISQRVEQAASRSGRKADDCQLLVVSKTWPAESVAEVVHAGQIHFGENKVQEASLKVPVLPPHLHWHLIGHLQRNKVRKALELFQTIHSIDSLKLARYTSRIASELGLRPNIYLQVNLASEESKNGYAIEALRDDIGSIAELEGLSIAGLMSIPPAAAKPEDARPWFAQLRELRDELEQQTGVSMPGLSMGMSGDFEVAIEEGSTIVRVGSAIFGSRK